LPHTTLADRFKLLLAV